MKPSFWCLNGASRLPGTGAHSSTYLTVCSVRYKLGDARCDDVWLKYDGKGSFLLIGELETSPIWLASARHNVQKNNNLSNDLTANQNAKGKTERHTRDT